MAQVQIHFIHWELISVKSQWAYLHVGNIPILNGISAVFGLHMSHVNS